MICSISDKQKSTIENNIDVLVPDFGIETAMDILATQYIEDTSRMYSQDIPYAKATSLAFMTQSIIYLKENEELKASSYVKKFLTGDAINTNLVSQYFGLDTFVTPMTVDNKELENEIIKLIPKTVYEQVRMMDHPDSPLGVVNGRPQELIKKVPTDVLTKKVILSSVVKILSANSRADLSLNHFNSLNIPNGYKAYGDFIDFTTKFYLTNNYFNADVNIFKDSKEFDTLYNAFSDTNPKLLKNKEGFSKSFMEKMPSLKYLLEDYYVLNGDNFNLYSPEWGISGIPDIILIHKTNKTVHILDVKSSLTKGYTDLHPNSVQERQKQVSLYAYLLTPYLPKGYKIGDSHFIVHIKGKLNVLESVELKDFKTFDYEDLKKEVLSKIEEISANIIIQRDNKFGDHLRVQSFLSQTLQQGTETQQSSLEYLNERFPEFKDADRIAELSLSSVGGVFTKDAITLNTTSDKGVEYHEAWHRFSQLYLTKDEKLKLYSSVRQSSINFVDRESQRLLNTTTASLKDIEEFLAEEFRNFEQNKEYSFDKFKEKSLIKRIFNAILKALGLFKSKSVQDYFTELHQNTFSRNNFSVDNGLFDELNMTLFTYDRDQYISVDNGLALTNIISEEISENLDLTGAKIGDYFKSPEKIEEFTFLFENILSILGDSIPNKYLGYTKYLDGDLTKDINKILNNSELFKQFFKDFLNMSQYKSLQTISKEVSRAATDEIDQSNVTTYEDMFSIDGAEIAAIELIDSRVIDLLVGIPILELKTGERVVDEDLNIIIKDNNGPLNFVTKESGTTLFDTDVLDRFKSKLQKNIPVSYRPIEVFNLIKQALQGKIYGSLQKEAWYSAINNNPSLAIAYNRLEMLREKGSIEGQVNANNTLGIENRALYDHAISILTQPSLPIVELLISGLQESHFFINEKGEKKAKDNIIATRFQELLTANVKTTISDIVTGFSKRHTSFNTKSMNLDVLAASFAPISSEEFITAFSQIKGNIKNSTTGKVYFNPAYFADKYGRFVQDDNGVSKYYLDNPYNWDPLSRALDDLGVYIPQTLKDLPKTHPDKVELINLSSKLVQIVGSKFSEIYTILRDEITNYISERELEGKKVNNQVVLQLLTKIIQENPLQTFFAFEERADNILKSNIELRLASMGNPLVISMGKIIAKYNSTLHSGVVTSSSGEEKYNTYHRQSPLNMFFATLNSVDRTQFSSFPGYEHFNLSINPQYSNSIVLNQTFNKSNKVELLKKVSNSVTYPNFDTNDIASERETIEEFIFHTAIAFNNEKAFPIRRNETSPSEYIYRLKDYFIPKGAIHTDMFNQVMFDYLSYGAVQYLETNDKISLFKDVIKEEKLLKDVLKAISKVKYKKGKVDPELDNKIKEALEPFRNKLNEQFRNFVKEGSSEIAKNINKYKNNPSYTALIVHIASKDKIKAVNEVLDSLEYMNELVEDFSTFFFMNDFIMTYEESMLLYGDYTYYKNPFKRRKLITNNGMNMLLEDGGLQIQEDLLGGFISSQFSDKFKDKKEHELRGVVLESVTGNPYEEELENFKKLDPTLSEKEIKEKYKSILSPYDSNKDLMDGDGAVSIDMAMRMAFKNMSIEGGQEGMKSKIEEYNKQKAYTRVVLDSWPQYRHLLKSPVTEEERILVKQMGVHSFNKLKWAVGGSMGFEYNEDNKTIGPSTSFTKPLFFKMALNVMLPTHYLTIKTEDDQVETPQQKFFIKMMEERVDYILDASASKAYTTKGQLKLFDGVNMVDELPKRLPFVSHSTLYMREQVNKEKYQNEAAAGSQRLIQFQHVLTNVEQKISKETDPEKLKALNEEKLKVEDTLSKRRESLELLLSYQTHTFLNKIGISSDYVMTDPDRFVEFIKENLETSTNINPKDLFHIIANPKSIEYSKNKDQIQSILLAAFHKFTNSLNLSGVAFTNSSQQFLNFNYGKKLKTYKIKDGQTLAAESIYTFTPSFHEPLFSLKRVIPYTQDKTIMKILKDATISKEARKNLLRMKIGETVEVEDGEIFIIDNEDFYHKLKVLNDHIGDKTIREKYRISLEGIGQRIPHSSLNFSFFDEVVHLLPPEMGQVIALPSGIMVAMGADNDADNVPKAIKALNNNSGLPVEYLREVVELFDEQGNPYSRTQYSKVPKRATKELFLELKTEMERLKKALPKPTKFYSIEELKIYEPLDTQIKMLQTALTKNGLEYSNDDFTMDEFGNFAFIDRDDIYEILDQSDELDLSLLDKYRKEKTTTNDNLSTAISLINISAINFLDKKKELDSLIKKKYRAAKENFSNFRKIVSNNYISNEIELMSTPSHYSEMRKTDDLGYFKDIVKEVDKELYTPEVIKKEKDKRAVTSEVYKLSFQADVQNKEIVAKRNILGAAITTVTQMTEIIYKNIEYNSRFNFNSTSKVKAAIKANMNEEGLSEHPKFSGQKTLKLPDLWYKINSEGRIPVSIENKGESTTSIMSLIATVFLDIANEKEVAEDLNIDFNSLHSVSTMLYTGATFREIQNVLQSPVVNYYLKAMREGNSLFKNESRYFMVDIMQKLFKEAAFSSEKYQIFNIEDGIKTLNTMMSRPEELFGNIISTKSVSQEDIQLFNKEFYKRANSKLNKEELFLALLDEEFMNTLVPGKSIKFKDVAKYAFAAFIVFDTHGKLMYNTELKGSKNNIKLEGPITISQAKEKHYMRKYYNLLSKSNGKLVTSDLYNDIENNTKFLENIAFPTLFSLPANIKGVLFSMMNQAENTDKSVQNTILNNFNVYLYTNYFLINGKSLGEHTEPLIDTIVDRFDALKEKYPFLKKDDFVNHLSSRVLYKRTNEPLIENPSSLNDYIQNEANKNTPVLFLEISKDVYEKTTTEQLYNRLWEKLLDFRTYKSTLSVDERFEIQQFFQDLMYYSLKVYSPFSKDDGNISNLLSDSTITLVMEESIRNFKELSSENAFASVREFQERFYSANPFFKTYDTNEERQYYYKKVNPPYIVKNPKNLIHDTTSPKKSLLQYFDENLVILNIQQIGEIEMFIEKNKLPYTIQDGKLVEKSDETITGENGTQLNLSC